MTALRLVDADPRTRVELLLRLGFARWCAGTGHIVETFRSAAHEARDLDGALFGRAVLEFCEVLPQDGHADWEPIRFIEDALRLVPGTEPLLRAQLRYAKGFGGRSRRPGAAAERARVNVSKAVGAALRRITGAHPTLGRHLDGAIRTGVTCCYQPDPAARISWRL